MFVKGNTLFKWLSIHFVLRKRLLSDSVTVWTTVEHSYAEIGRKLNLSREWIWEIANRALQKMRRDHKLNQLCQLI
ncbi:TPA: hypothetical protein EYM82_16370 [Candidatus Poribacteria bacterium]|nr:hypothetical protein [Candidatus Poribacteria bacterium]